MIGSDLGTIHLHFLLYCWLRTDREPVCKGDLACLLADICILGEFFGQMKVAPKRSAQSPRHTHQITQI